MILTQLDPICMDVNHLYVEVQNFDDISQRFEIFLFEKILRRINDTDDR